MSNKQQGVNGQLSKSEWLRPGSYKQNAFSKNSRRIFYPDKTQFVKASKD